MNLIMKANMLGIDLAKNIFQIHGVDSSGKAVLKKRIKREGLLAYMANIPTCKVAMEACGGANYRDQGQMRIFTTIFHSHSNIRFYL